MAETDWDNIDWDFEESCPCGALIRTSGEFKPEMLAQVFNWLLTHKDHIKEAQNTNGKDRPFYPRRSNTEDD